MVTSAPAIRPTMTAAAGEIKAQASLLATNPLIQPLALSEASGLPKRTRAINAAGKVAEAAASVVLIPNRSTRLGSAPGKKIAPADLQPCHPHTPSGTPQRTKTIL